MHGVYREKTTSMQTVEGSRAVRKVICEKESRLLLLRIRKAKYDFSACQNRARVVKRTSTGPSQVPKHGIGLL